MKSYVQYKFNQEQLTAELTTCGSTEMVVVTQFMDVGWDPVEQKEVQGLKIQIQMSPSDARELAENLLKAADHADEMGQAKSNRRY